jgi:hypothetical protein
MIKTTEEIRAAFEKIVAIKLTIRPGPQADLMASRQLLRDIQNGEIDREAGLEFLIAEEIRYGQSREGAKAHFERLLAGESSDWHPRPSGLVAVGGGTFKRERE